MPLTLDNLLMMDPSHLLYTVILPFIIAFTIFWGVLTAIRLFNSKINTIIAFVLATGLFFTDTYVFVGQFIFATGTFLAVGLFVLIFGVGVAIWAVGRTRSIYYQGFDSLDRLYKDRKKLLDKIQRAREDEKPRLYQELQNLDAAIKAKEHERGLNVHY